MKRGITCAVASAMVAVACAGTAHAAPGNWDHAANIKDAAKRLVKLHKKEGSPGVLKFLDACYRTHLLASSYTKGLESCLAQDYMHTRVLATIYARLPAEQRKKLGVPSPEKIAGGLNQRFVSAFIQYKVSVTDADDFKSKVDTHGFPLFVKGVFPKGAPGDTNATETKPAPSTGEGGK